MIDIKEQLIAEFSPAEVQTTEQLLQCMQGPPSGAKFRRIIMLLLRGHYSNSENYGDEYKHLSCYTYSEDPPGSLEVGFSQQNVYENPDKFPGIFVEFGGVELSRAAVGDFAGHSEDTSRTYVSRLATMTLLVHHVAQRASDAYDLADMTTMVLSAMAEPFCLRAGAMSLEVAGYAVPKKELEAPTRYYDVATSVKIAYTHSVTRSVESHRIRRIAMQITAE